MSAAGAPAAKARDDPGHEAGQSIAASIDEVGEVEDDGDVAAQARFAAMAFRCRGWPSARGCASACCCGSTP